MYEDWRFGTRTNRKQNRGTLGLFHILCASIILFVCFGGCQETKKNFFLVCHQLLFKQPYFIDWGIHNQIKFSECQLFGWGNKFCPVFFFYLFYIFNICFLCLSYCCFHLSQFPFFFYPIFLFPSLSLFFYFSFVVLFFFFILLWHFFILYFSLSFPLLVYLSLFLSSLFSKL